MQPWDLTSLGATCYPDFLVDRLDRHITKPGDLHINIPWVLRILQYEIFQFP